MATINLFSNMKQIIKKMIMHYCIVSSQYGTMHFKHTTAWRYILYHEKLWILLILLSTGIGLYIIIMRIINNARCLSIKNIK